MKQGVDSQRGAFASVTTLFFAWGFITASVDPLIAALKAIFSLSYREVGLTQFAFFIAYGVVSLLAAALVRRAGSPNAIVAALLVMRLQAAS
jgi:FHS family L-fucose permease-like MFS transporter